MLQVDWVVGTSGTEIGNHLGYASTNEGLRTALGAIAQLTPNAEIAVHYCHPSNFTPVYGKRNVLFTMYESVEVPEEFTRAFADADLIVVPSKFCEEIFRPHTDKPIRVCPLGLDVARFPYRRRKWRPGTGEPFRWLYVGAPNPRKWTILPQLWESTLSRVHQFNPDIRCELYIKTTGADFGRNVEAALDIGAEWDGQKVIRHEGVTLDNRRLSREELAQLYYDAHGFLFLHAGEGFGATGIEAMASGLPLVVSDYSGSQEYANRFTSYPVSVSVGPIECEPKGGSLVPGVQPAESVWLTAAWPQAFDAIDQSVSLMADYREATRRAERGAKVARRFTWEKSAARLRDLLAAL